MARLTILETAEKLEQLRKALCTVKMLTAAIHSEWPPTEEQIRSIEGKADESLAKLDDIEERLKL